MRVEFLRKFSKDLDRINREKDKAEILAAITLVKEAESMHLIRHLKKLRGHEDAYRIKVKDFRIGVFIQGDTVQFARVLHRKDIYNEFP